MPGHSAAVAAYTSGYLVRNPNSQMKAEEFVAALQRQNVSWFTGVPCSFFQAVYTWLEANARDRYLPAANEGAAMAIAAGAELAGQRTAVLIQNSGLGNLLNPLTSLQAPYRIPGLLFVSGRAFGVADEPQHEVMGRITPQLLELSGCRVQIMETEATAFVAQLASCTGHGDGPVNAFVVRKGTIASEKTGADIAAQSMSRLQALGIVASRISSDAAVLSTTGLTSRDWITLDDRPRSFYSMGSMGHVMSIGLGVSIARPDRPTIVLDGDGSLIMHLGALTTIGAAAPPRFLHLVLDNGAYESTGNQRTLAPRTDFAAIALACGYRSAVAVDTTKDLRTALDVALSSQGPAMIRIRVGAGEPETGRSARVTDRHSAPEIARNFSGFLRASG